MATSGATDTTPRRVDLLLHGGFVVPADGSTPFLADHSVAVEDRSIVAVGPAEEIATRYTAEQVVDCDGKAIVPGLVDCHVHTCQQLGRGLADDIPVLDWLTKVVSLEAVMDEEDVYASARLACVEMLKGGTTAFIEACANPVYADAAAQAIVDSGIRGVLTRSTMQYQEPDWEAPTGFLMDPDENLEATRELLERWNGEGDGRLSVWCGWRQQWNLSDELVVDLVELAREHGVGLHGHLATRRYGQIELLDRLGVLGPELVFAHAIRFTAREQDLIDHHDVKINHNPGASMHGAYGSAVAGSFPELHRRGVCVCLGCDGAANGNTLDMWQATRLAAGLHKEVRQDATVIPAPDALAMATRNGARALRRDDLGTIAEGRTADLQVVDLRQPHLLPWNDLVATLVYCASAQDVWATVVDGRLLMEGRELVGVDEDAVLDEAIERGEGIARRVRERSPEGRGRE